jgi:hypothetical protein
MDVGCLHRTIRNGYSKERVHVKAGREQRRDLKLGNKRPRTIVTPATVSYALHSFEVTIIVATPQLSKQIGTNLFTLCVPQSNAKKYNVDLWHVTYESDGR